MPFLVDVDDSDDDLGINEVPFGTFRAQIVGIRYYKGTVNRNEMVSMTREPYNPYDRNAIRINNVGGVQVGHIKREQARVLSTIIDKGTARAEGVVPFGTNNKFSMPCDITLWGDEENKDQVIKEMNRGGLHLSSYKSKEYGSNGSDGNSSIGPRGPMVHSVKVSAQAMKRELDQMFEKLTETSVSTISEPADALKTKLYPHQLQALSWMMACENGNSLPPFWEERGPKDFFNSATNFSAPKRPESVRGGILADDMGLGKTLEVISLIVTNFKNGKNLVTIDKTKEVVINAEDGEIIPKRKRKRTPSSHISKRESFKEILNVNDEEDDAKMEAELPPLPSFTSKEDPDFILSTENAPPMESNISKRPQRASKRPVRYTVDDDEECVSSSNLDTDLMENAGKEKSKRKKPRKTNSKSKFNEIQPTNQLPSQEQLCVSETVIVDGDTFKVDGETVIVDGGNLKVDGEIVIGDEGSMKVENETVIVDGGDSKVAGEIVVGDGETSQVHCSQNGAVAEVNQDNCFTLKTYTSKKTKASGPRATLVICPLSVLSNWQAEISEHVWPGLLDVHTYYGSDRIRDPSILSQKDIVLTTYQTLATEASKHESALMQTKWLRIVLDEGHCIRNPNALQTKKIHELQAERRWVVTGTPIQNSMKDLWSLICFLRLDPFTDRQWWTRVMERPIKNGDKDAIMRLQQVMKVIALRRTKTQRGSNGKPIVDIPEKNIFVSYVELSPEERDIYKAVAEEGKITIGKYLKAGTLLKNYSEVLVILTRLRQLCCHPQLCTAALEAAAKQAMEGSTPEELRKRLTAILSMVISGVSEDCPICMDPLDLPVITHCAHIFCRKCIEMSIERTSPTCPMCRGSISVDKLVDPPADQEEDSMESNEWNSSAKVDALLNALEKQRQADATVKCLVVSQFASYLRLLKKPLEGRGFSFVHLDGSMNQEQRSRAIKEFSDKSQNSPRVFLLSLKAGGVGLNLTAASKVYLMEPAWNPAAEDQCFDRCHRLGQTRPVEIHKFVIKNSIEERMLEMQDRKKMLMSGAFAKPKAEEARQQRIKDVANLMNFA